MSGQLLVDVVALRAAAALWRDQAEELAGAERSLATAQPSELGALVAPVARDFLAGWAGRLQALQALATGYAQALEETAGAVLTADTDTRSDLERLLPFAGPVLSPGLR